MVCVHILDFFADSEGLVSHAVDFLGKPDEVLDFIVFDLDHPLVFMDERPHAICSVEEDSEVNELKEIRSDLIFMLFDKIINLSKPKDIGIAALGHLLVFLFKSQEFQEETVCIYFKDSKEYEFIC